MLKNKITLFLVFAVVIGISVAVFLVSLKGEAQAQQGQQNNDKKEIKVRDVQKEKEKFEPTSIQEGVMTAKQKKHSKIFKGYKNRPKLRDLMDGKDDIEVREEVGDVILPQSFNLNTYLQGLSCRADAVLIGTVKNKASQINEDGTFIFTDYELVAEDVLKNNAIAPINSNTNITVTRAGGAIKLKGHIARAMDAREVPLIVGEHYLLYLKFVPDTGAYKSLDSSRDDDSFQILGDRKVQQVSMVPLPFGGNHLTDSNAFLTEVRAALSSGCENQGGVK